MAEAEKFAMLDVNDQDLRNEIGGGLGVDPSSEQVTNQINLQNVNISLRQSLAQAEQAKAEALAQQQQQQTPPDTTTIVPGYTTEHPFTGESVVIPPVTLGPTSFDIDHMRPIIGQIELANAGVTPETLADPNGQQQPTQTVDLGGGTTGITNVTVYPDGRVKTTLDIVDKDGDGTRSESVNDFSGNTVGGARETTLTGGQPDPNWTLGVNADTTNFGPANTPPVQHDPPPIVDNTDLADVLKPGGPTTAAGIDLFNSLPDVGNPSDVNSGTPAATGDQQSIPVTGDKGSGVLPGDVDPRQINGSTPGDPINVGPGDTPGETPGETPDDPNNIIPDTPGDTPGDTPSEVPGDQPSDTQGDPNTGGAGTGVTQIKDDFTDQDGERSVTWVDGDGNVWNNTTRADGTSNTQYIGKEGELPVADGTPPPDGVTPPPPPAQGSGTSGGTPGGSDPAAGGSGTDGSSGTSGTSGSGGNDGSSGTSGSGGNDGSSGTSGSGGNDGSSGTSGSGGNDGSGGTDGSSGSSGSGSDGSGSSGGDDNSGSSGSTGTTGSGSDQNSGMTDPDASTGSTGSDGSWDKGFGSSIHGGATDGTRPDQDSLDTNAGDVKMTNTAGPDTDPDYVGVGGIGVSGSLNLVTAGLANIDGPRPDLGDITGGTDPVTAPPATTGIDPHASGDGSTGFAVSLTMGATANVGFNAGFATGETTAGPGEAGAGFAPAPPAASESSESPIRDVEAAPSPLDVPSPASESELGTFALDSPAPLSPEGGALDSEAAAPAQPAPAELTFGDSQDAAPAPVEPAFDDSLAQADALNSAFGQLDQPSSFGDDAQGDTGFDQS